MSRVLDSLDTPHPKAVYLGACHGDDPAQYMIFTSAMALAGIVDCHAIPTEPGPEDLQRLSRSNLILLAGGNPGRGWAAFENHGVTELIQRRYREGALLMGISAGAILLGALGWEGERPTVEGLFPALGLVPMVISVHEDPGWPLLRIALSHGGIGNQGVGIPMGGGLFYHASRHVEPIHRPTCHFSNDGGTLRETALPAGSRHRIK